VVFGSAAGTTILNGGIAQVVAGASASGTTVSSGGAFYVAATAINTTLSGGTQVVFGVAQNKAIGLTGDPVALGSANGLTVSMNSQRLREAAASLTASRSARSSTWMPRIAWTKL
jgi:autotransporter passenger strand-loop-strand repeat protein